MVKQECRFYQNILTVIVYVSTLSIAQSMPCEIIALLTYGDLFTFLQIKDHGLRKVWVK
jgi:hypothetical protein